MNSDTRSCNFITDNTPFSSLLSVKPGTVICILASSPEANMYFLNMLYILGLHTGFFSKNDYDDNVRWLRGKDHLRLHLCIKIVRL